ncbi:MAG: hypothetical protein H7237_03685 [Alkalinema sp. FL-bin-369]|nr:hypothetical protein [Leptolyngbyaceae cyanobacterium LF-bin-369]
MLYVVGGASHTPTASPKPHSKYFGGFYIMPDLLATGTSFSRSTSTPFARAIGLR